MKIIVVKPGTITPAQAPATIIPDAQASAPLKATHPGGKATKELMLTRIKTHLERAKAIIKNGDRRVISPEAMLWVERAVPSASTNTLDVLRGIESTLSRGIPPLPENQQIRESALAHLSHYHQRAKELWAKGNGGSLPSTATKAAATLKNLKLESLSVAEIHVLITALGGNI